MRKNVGGIVRKEDQLKMMFYFEKICSVLMIFGTFASSKIGL